MSEVIFLTVNEAAEMLRIHPKTVQRYLRLGKLPGMKLGKAWRVPRSALLSMAKALHEAEGCEERSNPAERSEQEEPEYLSTAEIITIAGKRAKELAFRNRYDVVAQYQQLLEAIEAEANSKSTATEDNPDGN